MRDKDLEDYRKLDLLIEQLSARIKELEEGIEKHRIMGGESYESFRDEELYKLKEKKKCEGGPGEEDGPWAEGWEERRPETFESISK